MGGRTHFVAEILDDKPGAIARDAFAEGDPTTVTLA